MLFFYQAYCKDYTTHLKKNKTTFIELNGYRLFTESFILIWLTVACSGRKRLC